MQHWKLRADRCPRIIIWIIQLDYKYIYNIVTAGRVDSTLRPAVTRSQSTNSRELGDQFRESTKIKKNTNKEDDIDRAQGDLLRDLPDWLEEFTENFVDERVPSSRDTPTSSSTEDIQNLFGK